METSAQQIVISPHLKWILVALFGGILDGEKIGNRIVKIVSCCLLDEVPMTFPAFNISCVDVEAVEIVASGYCWLSSFVNFVV